MVNFDFFIMGDAGLVTKYKKLLIGLGYIDETLPIIKLMKIDSPVAIYSNKKNILMTCMLGSIVYNEGKNSDVVYKLPRDVEKLNHQIIYTIKDFIKLKQKI